MVRDFGLIISAHPYQSIANLLSVTIYLFECFFNISDSKIKMLRAKWSPNPESKQSTSQKKSLRLKEEDKENVVPDATLVRFQNTRTSFWQLH